jgi:IS5 family transposase
MRVLQKITIAGVDLGRTAALDETTILNVRHLLETRDLCGKVLDVVNWCPDRQGIRISVGTIVDATIIAAPTSTRTARRNAFTEATCQCFHCH